MTAAATTTAAAATTTADTARLHVTRRSCCRRRFLRAPPRSALRIARRTRRLLAFLALNLWKRQCATSHDDAQYCRQKRAAHRATKSLTQ